MSVWLWLQPGHKAWKVIMDYEKGTIVVYSEKGEILLERKGLSRAVMSIIESNFLSVVATRVSDIEKDEVISSTTKSTISIDNPMYV